MAAKRPYEQDPDYDEIPSEVQEKRMKIIEKDLRKQTKSKIETILRAQFQEEIFSKDNEIEKLDNLLHESRCILDRLRACIVTKYYTSPSNEDGDSANIEVPIHSSVKQFLGKAPKNHCDIPLHGEDSKPKVVEAPLVEQITPPVLPVAKSSTHSNEVAAEETPILQAPRVRTKYEIVIGNVSKFIPTALRIEDEQLTHLWKAYVREGRGYTKISEVAKKVCFFLHPSFRPHDVVEVCEPPFEILRRGWGDFPLRVQIHFKDPYNKPVDIIHYLKLDKTYLGLTKLGPETHAEVQLLGSKPLVDALKVNPPPAERVVPPPTRTSFDSAIVKTQQPTDHTQSNGEIVAPPKTQNNAVPKSASSAKAQLGILNSEAKRTTVTMPKKILSNSALLKSAAGGALGGVLNGMTSFLKCTDSQGRTLLVPQSSLLLKTGAEAVKLVPASKSADAQQASQKNKLPLYVLKVLSSQQNKKQHTGSVLLLSKTNESMENTYGIVPPEVLKNGLVLTDLKTKLSVAKKANSTETNSVSHWREAVQNINISTCSDFQAALKKLIRYFPIIQEQSNDRSILPFSAPSHEDYLTWNIGKRRAAEWQRAGMVRSAITRLLEKNPTAHFKPSDVWSRKQIMIFCRRYGYTPQLSESTTSAITTTASTAISSEGTFTDAKDLIELVNQQQLVHSVLEEDVDVETNDVPDTSDVAQTTVSPARPQCSLVQHSSLAASFVKETASELSISLKPVEFEPGIFLPTVEDMILSACKAFSEDILRSAINQNYKRTGGKACADEVSLSDVYNAIKEDSSLEFVTNKYLGVIREHAANR